MSARSNWFLGALAGVAFALPALAEAPVRGPDTASNPPCFFLTQWQGWKAPSPDVIYLRINRRDVYRVELTGGSPQLMWPSYHLIYKARGSSSICNALDLDLSISDGHGFRQPLIARSLVKLSPDEAAAIPPKFQP